MEGDCSNSSQEAHEACTAGGRAMHNTPRLVIAHEPACNLSTPAQSLTFPSSTAATSALNTACCWAALAPARAAPILQTTSAWCFRARSFRLPTLVSTAANASSPSSRPANSSSSSRSLRTSSRQFSNAGRITRPRAPAKHAARTARPACARACALRTSAASIRQ